MDSECLLAHHWVMVALWSQTFAYLTAVPLNVLIWNQKYVGCGILPLWHLRNNYGIYLNRDFP